jgi:hypothetical protein
MEGIEISLCSWSHFLAFALSYLGVMVAGVSDVSILRKKRKNAHFHQKLSEIAKT